MTVNYFHERPTSVLAPDRSETFFFQFHKKTFEYDSQSRHCRWKDGVELPDTSPEAVSRLNEGELWQNWGGLRLSVDRCYFVRPKGTPVMFTTVQRILGRFDTPIRAVQPYLSIPNGQVKNFLNACRAANGLQNQSRIAVVGSKAAESGGLWHEYFVLYLQMLYNVTVVDFFDFSEREKNRVYKTANSFVSCEWIEGGFDQTLVGNYDLIIDDTWSYSSGPGLHLNYTGAYSWKGTAEITSEFKPFLHSTETRSFSSPPRDDVRTGCRCPVCRVIKQSTRTYSQYLFVRMLCSRLGYVATCEGLPDQSDMKKAGEVLRDLMTDSVIDLRIGVMIRATMAISEEVPLEVSDGHVRQGVGEPKFVPLNRMDLPHQVEVELPVYKWLEGRKIVFCGVPSTVIGGTRIVNHTIGGATPQDADVAFVSSFDVWQHQQSTPVVYAPYSPMAVVDRFPDWQSTGKQVLSMWEYVRQQVLPLPLSLQTPGQFCLHRKGPRHTLFPYLDVHLLGNFLRGRGKPVQPLQFFSLQMEEKVMHLRPLKAELWRKSIWVSSAFEWGPLVEAIEFVGHQEGFMAASVPLPWDMSLDEIEEVEDRVKGNLVSWRSEPGLIFRATDYAHVKKKKPREFRIMGIPVGPALERQSEFVRVGSLASFHIVRGPKAHPVSFFQAVPEVYQEWQYLLSETYMDGFKKICDIIDRIRAVHVDDWQAKQDAYVQRMVHTPLSRGTYVPSVWDDPQNQ